MSFSFISKPEIKFDDLMSGQLEAYGIRAVQTEEATGLESKSGFVHVLGQPGFCSFCAYGLGGNNALPIADAIRNHFNVDLISERDERYFMQKIGD